MLTLREKKLAMIIVVLVIVILVQNGQRIRDKEKIIQFIDRITHRIIIEIKDPQDIEIIGRMFQEEGQRLSNDEM